MFTILKFLLQIVLQKTHLRAKPELNPFLLKVERWYQKKIRNHKSLTKHINKIYFIIKKSSEKYS